MLLRGAPLEAVGPPLVRRGGLALVLPGPPRELEPMFAELAAGRLAARSSTKRLYRRVLRVAGRGESHVEELTQPVYEPWQRARHVIETTILASPGAVELHLSTRVDTASAAQAVLDGATAELAAVLGEHLVSTDGRTLADVVGTLLLQHGYRVAIGESCTGGLVTAALVDSPGSSKYLDQGIVAYSNDAKRTALGVEAAVLAEHGAVSEPVAEAMAVGARRAGADVGVGVTGIAGPGGGTADKPVGTVCFAVVAPEGRRIVRTVLLPGDRAMIRQMATRTALDLLRRALERPPRHASVRSE